MKDKKESQQASDKKNDKKIEILEEEYKNLQDQAKELEILREKLVRSAADFENAKKRLTRERDEFVKFSQERIIGEILPVLDNFERALGHAEKSDLASDSENPAGKELGGLISGVKMVQKQLLDILKAYGLAPIKTLGEVFNPHLHEAIAYVTEDGKEDEIVDEISSGYMLHDRVLKAPKVRVRIAPKKENVDTSEEKEEEIT